jgi:hypothetical protein
LGKLFGISSNEDEEQAKQDPEVAKIVADVRKQLADVLPAIEANDMRPSQEWATASIFSEFFPEHVIDEAPDLMVYDGELGNMRVYLVTPVDDSPRVFGALHLPKSKETRVITFFDNARIRYLKTSTRSELIHTPPGNGHNYPHQIPEFVVETVRRILAAARDSSTAR